MRTLPSYLATEADEVVVVDDGSTIEHRELLESVASLDRVRLVTLPRHLGLPVARNEGAARSGSEWVVFGEDDAWFLPDYPDVVIAHALDAGAEVASGQEVFVHPDLLDADREVLEKEIRTRPPRVMADDLVVGSFWPRERLPSGDLVTPSPSAWAAVHRTVFERVAYDPRFRGNAFREETDFYLSCWEAGIRTLLCDHARAGHVKIHARSLKGGAWAMSTPRYAAYMVWNNWRLLSKHRELLGAVRRSAGRSGDPARMQAEFVASLARGVRPRRV